MENIIPDLQNPPIRKKNLRIWCAHPFFDITTRNGEF
jgi:hypothetical protein